MHRNRPDAARVAWTQVNEEKPITTSEVSAMRGNDDFGNRTVLCFAESNGRHWEAFCLDFDLAVQGHSFEEVYRKLNEQVQLFIEGVCELPAPERTRLLKRRAPIRLWMRPLRRLLAAMIFRRDSKERHDYSYPLRRLHSPA